MQLNIFQQLRYFLTISQSHAIARRYFIVNGFDGALTMLGMLVGFYISETIELSIAITTCLAASIALSISGVSSAYISELAERKKSFRELQKAMLSEMAGSTHEKASRVIPLLIAAVNGLAPLLLSLIIISPLLLVKQGVDIQFAPFPTAIILAFILIFLLGVFLGKISGTFWLFSGVQSLLVAIITMLIIFLLV